MIPTLTQSLLQWMLWFAIASIVGVVGYGFVKWVRKSCPNSSGEVLCLVVAFPHLLPIISVWFILIPVWIVGWLCCGGSAFAEQAISGDERSYGFHYSTLLLATALSLNITGLLLVVSSEVADNWIATLFGALSGPSSVPIFLWMWHSSKSRPGVERHLDESEH